MVAIAACYVYRQQVRTPGVCGTAVHTLFRAFCQIPSAAILCPSFTIIILFSVNRDVTETDLLLGHYGRQKVPKSKKKKKKMDTPINAPLNYLKK